MNFQDCCWLFWYMLLMDQRSCISSNNKLQFLVESSHCQVSADIEPLEYTPKPECRPGLFYAGPILVYGWALHALDLSIIIRFYQNIQGFEHFGVTKKDVPTKLRPLIVSFLFAGTKEFSRPTTRKTRRIWSGGLLGYCTQKGGAWPDPHGLKWSLTMADPTWPELGSVRSFLFFVTQTFEKAMRRKSYHSRLFARSFFCDSVNWFASSNGSLNALISWYAASWWSTKVNDMVQPCHPMPISNWDSHIDVIGWWLPTMSEIFFPKNDSMPFLLLLYMLDFHLCLHVSSPFFKWGLISSSVYRFPTKNKSGPATL